MTSLREEVEKLAVKLNICDSDAEAVMELVLERCARECEAEVLLWGSGFNNGAAGARSCAARIRAMKGEG